MNGNASFVFNILHHKESNEQLLETEKLNITRRKSLKTSREFYGSIDLQCNLPLFGSSTYEIKKIIIELYNKTVHMKQRDKNSLQN